MGHVAIPEMSRALVAGDGAMRHVVTPELPCSRRWMPQDTRACASVLSFIFYLELLHGGTRSSGYRQSPDLKYVSRGLFVKNIFQKGQNKKIHLKLCLFELEKILAFIQLHGKEIGL
jgi:hypothetical protein